MPRLPEVTDRNALPEDKREIHDYLAKTRGAVRPPFSIVLNNPELCYRVAHVGSFIRFEGSLPAKVRELAVLAAAREFDVRYEWAAHARMAGENGIGQDLIDVIGHKRPLDGLSLDDALPIEFARQVLREHRISDDLFAEAHKRYGNAGVVELLGTVGYYAMLGCLLNGLEIEPAADAIKLP